MNYKYDVHFCIEHKDRELEPLSAVARKLKSKHNLTSIITSKDFHPHLLTKESAKLFAYYFVLNQKDWPIEMVTNYYGDSVEILNMNWEQLLFPVNEVYKAPRCEFTKNKIWHVSWSEHFNNFLTRNGVNKDKITITGNIATEILKKQAAEDGGKLKTKLAAEFNLNSQKSWYFFPMNYAWAFSDDRTIEGKISKGYPADKAWKYREYCQSCLKQFIPFLKELHNNKDNVIILRPHPSISVDDYTEMFKDFDLSLDDRLILTRDYSAREWLIASDTTISSLSTTVWDAVNIGKPGYLFTPNPRPEWLEVWWNKYVPNIKSVTEIKDSYDFKDYKNYITDNAVENTADFIAEILKNRPTSDQNWPKLKTTQHKKIELRRRLAKYLRFLKRFRSIRYDYIKPVRFK